jgi:secondary thiamine-phosphate synthase enzyme
MKAEIVSDIFRRDRMETIEVKTGSRIQFVDISARVREVVARSKVQEGIVVVYVPHTTAGVTINEAADPSVVEDIVTRLSELVPYRGPYRHMEGNSDAHIKATLVGSSVHLIVSRGTVRLGTWQGVFFCEFDGPRTRNVHIKVLTG